MIVERKRIFTCPGDRFEPILEPQLQDDGTIELIEVGKRDLQEYIQSFAEEVTLANILRRYQMGDETALAKVQGTYMDTTVMPKNFREVLDSVISGQNMFDQLPLEVKQKFNNDFNQWFVGIGSDEWMSNMGFEKPSESVSDEVGKEKTDGES